MIPYGSLQYFTIVGAGACLSTAATRVMMAPMDLVKCRMQVNPEKYDKFFKGMKISFREDGFRGLFAGWAPNSIGYGLRGAANYGVYEFSKCKLNAAFGEENAHTYRSVIFSISAVFGEIVGGLVLAPFEVAKVRSQTDPMAPRQIMKCMPMIYKEGGIPAMFTGLTPLLWRLIPSSVVKFVAFDYTSAALYDHYIRKSPKDCSNPERMKVCLTASVVSGMANAISSHPPDVWTSLKCRNKEMGLWKAVKATGFRRAFDGLTPRLFLTTNNIVIQFCTIEVLRIMFNVELPAIK